MMTCIIQSGLMLSLFYLFFILLMKKTTFFRFNRLMLMSGSFICMLLPLLDISFLPETSIAGLPHLEIPKTAAAMAVVEEQGGWNWIAALGTVYFVGMAVVVICFTVSIFKTLAMCRQGEIVRRNGVTITVTDGSVASFSFFRHIVMNREDYERNPLILQHEMMHVECRHSIDVILFSIINAVHWFNPLVWMARNALKEVQEYEADESLLKQGVDATQYQLLLVRKAVGAERFRMANGFNHTKLKNRIGMMQSGRTAGIAKLTYLVCLPLLLSVMGFCADKDCAFRELDEIALFKGEDPGAFVKWMNEQLSYSEIVNAAGINGRLNASITIDRKGRVVNPRIVRGLSDGIDSEVLRILILSPDWTPAIKDGKAVKCTYTFPVIINVE